MQTDALYIDLRVPAGRPDFTGCSALQDCTDVQLDWLAGQKGFAGSLEVKDTIFQWHRVLDFQPDRSVRDIGRMTQRQGYMLEEGIDSDFREHWCRITAGGTESGAWRLAGSADNDGSPLSWRGYFLTVGGYFMLALDRRGDLPQAASLRDLACGDRATLLRALDMEISFGEYRAAEARYVISLSNHPFREGVSVFGAGPTPVTGRALRQTDRGQQLVWAPVLAAESTGPA